MVKSLPCLQSQSVNEGRTLALGKHYYIPSVTRSAGIPAWKYEIGQLSILLIVHFQVNRI